MNIYIGKNKKNAVKISLRDLLASHIRKLGVDIDMNSFNDNSSSWIEIKQKTKKPSEVAVVISFNGDGTEYEDISVYETPIITILDQDNSVKII